MQLDGSPAPTDVTPVAPETPDYSSPNDLDFEMTPEQEQAYVDTILGTSPTEPVVPTPVETPVAPVAPVIEPVQPVEEVKPTVVEPTVIEPIKTDDLWIEVDKVTTDELGDETVEKVRLVYDPANPDSFVPDDFIAKNDKQRIAIMEAKAEIASTYNARKSDFDTKQGELTANETREASQKTLLDSWDAEIATLIEVGALEAPKAKLGDANYHDDPSVKKTDEVFTFMAKSNADRSEKGLPPITSFGTALTMYEKDATRVAEEAEKARKSQETKQKGALIGGSSSASAGADGPKPYKAGSANSIWAVPVE
jgi:hypothetical protein